MSTTTNNEPTSAIDSLFEARHLLDAFVDRIQCSDIVDEMHRTAAYAAFVPDVVAYLVLEGGNSDEHGNGEYDATGYDASGHEIDECYFTAPGPAFTDVAVPDVFRPDHHEPTRGQEHPPNIDLTIDVAHVLAHDFERDAKETRDALATLQIQEMHASGDAAGRLVTREDLTEAVYAEALAYEVALSPEIVEAAADAIITDPRLDAAFARASDDMHALAAEQVEARISD